MNVAPQAPPRQSLLNFNASTSSTSSYESDYETPSVIINSNNTKPSNGVYEYCDAEELMRQSTPSKKSTSPCGGYGTSVHMAPLYEDFGLESKDSSFVPSSTFKGTQVDHEKERMIQIAKECSVNVVQSKKPMGRIGKSRTRQEAEGMIRLAGASKGLFLFRESRGLMVLSLSDGNTTHHLKVEEKGQNVPASQFGESEFRAFVSYYSKQLDKLPVLLETMLV